MMNDAEQWTERLTKRKRSRCVLLGFALAASLVFHVWTAPSAYAAADDVTKSAEGEQGQAAKENENERSRADKATPAQRRQERIENQPLTVTGAAINENGTPVAGATVFLVSTAPAKLLAKTTTGRDGRYEFRDAQLPVPVSRQTGEFQLFGKAPAHGFAWCGRRFLYLKAPRGGQNGQLDARTRETGFLAGQDIEIDLVFTPARALSGRFVDEMGKPIENVKVHLRGCSALEGSKSDRNRREYTSDLNTLGLVAELMPDQVLTASDSDGRFEFKSAPAETVCWLSVEHPNYGRRAFYTAVSDEPPPRAVADRPLVPAPVEMTLKKARSISIRVRSEQTKEPIDKARLFAGIERSRARTIGSSSGATTGPEGTVTLMLPPGEYNLTADPPNDTQEDLIRTTVPLVVGDALEQQIEVTVKQGCVLILKAVDADSGEGVPGVVFWYQAHGGGRRPVQSRNWVYNNAKSDEKGELRAVVEPGKGRYGVHLQMSTVKLQRDENTANGTELDLPAGETVTAEFLVHK